jgi:hypothetical protein
VSDLMFLRCDHARLLFSRQLFFKYLIVLFNFLGSDYCAITLNDIRLYIVGTMNCPTSCTKSVKRDLIIITLLFYSAASYITEYCELASIF